MMKWMSFLAIAFSSLQALAAEENSGKTIAQPKAKAVTQTQEYNPEADIWPTDNPEEWNFIISGNEKCWYHTKTLKKVCEKTNSNQ